MHFLLGRILVRGRRRVSRMKRRREQLLYMLQQLQEGKKGATVVMCYFPLNYRYFAFSVPSSLISLITHLSLFINALIFTLNSQISYSDICFALLLYTLRIQPQKFAQFSYANFIYSNILVATDLNLWIHTYIHIYIYIYIYSIFILIRYQRISILLFTVSCVRDVSKSISLLLERNLCKSQDQLYKSHFLITFSISTSFTDCQILNTSLLTHLVGQGNVVV